MSDPLSATISVCHGLGPADLVDARELLLRCNKHEGLDLSLNLDLDGAPDTAELSQYLYRENGALVGCLSADGSDDVEITLGVDPSHRRRGVGRRLLDAARTDCVGRGLTSWTLVIDEASPSGRAFVLAVGATYRSSEYRLELARDRIPVPRVWDPAVELRQAGPAEAELVGRLAADSFGASREETIAWIRRDLAKPNHRFDVATLAGESIGQIRTNYYGEIIFVTAFGILPKYRGRGYGRQILEATVRRLVADNWPTIRIEVSMDNVNALGLYQSSGFDLRTAYGYFEQAL
jgi:ribosomal protein S18 acetylase RimI-like enzyme